MRSSLVARGVSVTAAVLLMTACGGSSDDDSSASSSTSAASSSAAETSSEAPASDSEFCTEASQINERISSSIGTGDPSALSDDLKTIADQISGVEPPPEIADDWNSLADAFGKVSSALDGIDLTDPDDQAKAQAELSDLQEQLGDAGANVETYLREQCGIDTGGTGTSDSAAPSS